MPDFFIDSLDDPLLDVGARAFTAVNSAVNPTVIDPGTLRNSRNLYMEGDGVCRRRPCLVKVVGPGAAPVVSAIWYDTPDMEAMVLCRAGQLSAYPGDIEGFVETPIGVSGLGEGRVPLAQLVDLLLAARPEGGLSWARYAGGAWNTGSVSVDAEGTQLPRFSFLCPHAFRMFAAQEGSDILWTSDVLSADVPAAWSQLRTLRIGTGEGDPITAILPFQEQGLLVLKEHSVWLLDATGGDPSAWAIRRLTGLAGCIAGRTAVQLGQDVLFLSRLGVLSLSALSRSDSVSTASSVSAPIRADFDRINWSIASDSFAGVWRQHYLLSAHRDTETSPAHLLAFNTETKTWSGLWPIATPLSASCITRMGGRQETMIMTTDGAVWRLDPKASTEPLGDGWLEAVGETKCFDWDAGHVGKRAMRLEVTMECRSAVDISIQIRPDRELPVEVSGTMSYSSSCVLPVTLPIHLDRNRLVRKAWNLRPLLPRPVRDLSVVVRARCRGSFALGGVTLSACAEGVR